MTKNDTTIFIKGDYVTLGQILKFLDLVQTGGEEKIFLAERKSESVMSSPSTKRNIRYVCQKTSSS